MYQYLSLFVFAAVITTANAAQPEMFLAPESLEASKLQKSAYIKIDESFSIEVSGRQFVRYAYIQDGEVVQDQTKFPAADFKRPYCMMTISTTVKEGSWEFHTSKPAQGSVEVTQGDVLRADPWTSNTDRNYTSFSTYDVELKPDAPVLMGFYCSSPKNTVLTTGVIQNEIFGKKISFYVNKSQAKTLGLVQ